MRTFDIVLTGRTLPGFETKNAAAALASTLRVPEEKARELLTGRETVLKRGLAEEQLPPYVEALRKCGAEVRAREVIAAPDKVKCPACGAEQPPRNLCRACGADMKRVAAAQEAAKNPPKPKIEPVSSAAAARESPDTPLYRRTLLIEILFFLFLTPYWAWKLMTDRERGRVANVIGGVILIGSSVQLFLLVNDIRKHGWMGEDGPLFEAVTYATDARRQVDEFTAANRRFPERGEVSAPGARPASVETVEIGPRGRVRVVLASELKGSAGGSLLLTPYFDDKGGWGWECETAGVEARWLARNCTMNP